MEDSNEKMEDLSGQEFSERCVQIIGNVLDLLFLVKQLVWKWNWIDADKSSDEIIERNPACIVVFLCEMVKRLFRDKKLPFLERKS